jgi:hypothetical protein
LIAVAPNVKRTTHPSFEGTTFISIPSIYKMKKKKRYLN